MNTLLTVIVAGGSGQRMGSATPKQFIELDNKPIIMHTIERMAHAVERWIDSVDPQVLTTCGSLTTTAHIADCVINNDANVVNNDIDNTVINNANDVRNTVDNTAVSNVINSDGNTVINNAIDVHNNIDNTVINSDGNAVINNANDVRNTVDNTAISNVINSDGNTVINNVNDIRNNIDNTIINSDGNTVINNVNDAHNTVDNTAISNIINGDGTAVINNVINGNCNAVINNANIVHNNIDYMVINNGDNIVNNTTGKPHINHQIVLVLPTDHMDTWQELCRIHNFRHRHTVVQGGETRFHSVGNGLATLPHASIVLVHDGVRPFVSDRAVSDAINAAIQHGAAIPAVEVTDSLRLVDTNGGSQAVDRATYRAVQTPQVFRGSVLRNAYLTPYRSRFTDDASVVENAGHKVELTRGDATNIKITTPTDLIIARELIKQQKHN